MRSPPTLPFPQNLERAPGATARKEFSYDVIFGVPCYWFATGATGATARKEFSYDVIFWSNLLLVTTGATGATARKEFIYDFILLEYLATGLLQVLQVLQLARSLAMTSFFLEYLATGLLQVLQLARSLAMTSFFLEYLATDCYRCYSSQGVHL